MRRVPAYLLVLAAGLGACGSASDEPGGVAGARAVPEPAAVRNFVEQPVRSDRWVESDALPAWVGAPQRAQGALRFALDSPSDLRDIAVVRADRFGELDIGARVEKALAPVVGAEDAARAAGQVPGALRLLARASKEESSRGSLVPGAGLVTVWSLWEVPVDPVVAVLPEEKRAVAAAALVSESERK